MAAVLVTEEELRVELRGQAVVVAAPRPRRPAPPCRCPLAVEVRGDVTLVEQCTAVDLDGGEVTGADLFEDRGAADTEQPAELVDVQQRRNAGLRGDPRGTGGGLLGLRRALLLTGLLPACVPEKMVGRRVLLAVEAPRPAIGAGGRSRLRRGGAGPRGTGVGGGRCSSSSPSGRTRALRGGRGRPCAADNQGYAASGVRLGATPPNFCRRSQTCRERRGASIRADRLLTARRGVIAGWRPLWLPGQRTQLRVDRLKAAPGSGSLRRAVGGSL